MFPFKHLSLRYGYIISDICVSTSSKGDMSTESHELMLCKAVLASAYIIIVLDFFKCIGLYMHYISLYGALSLHNCSSSGSQVFAHLGGINQIMH